MGIEYRPPFTLTSAIVSLVAEISEALGRLSAVPEASISLRLRRINRIRSIQGSLAIEGNTLSESQITAILEGKRVLAPPREIQEARNALLAYEQLGSWLPYKKADMLAVHAIVMAGLLDQPGCFRIGSVGIMKGKNLVHLAPPAERVPALMKDLLSWLKGSKDHPLITSSIFHYEFEFIHPFADGNGRMGRLWQTLILASWNPLLAYIPVETLVYRHQAEYYAALNQSGAKADSSPFIDFMLRMIRDAIVESAALSEKKPEKTSEKILRLIAENPELTIAELARLIKLTARTIERNLQGLQAQGRLRRIGPDKGGHWEIVKDKVITGKLDGLPNE
jgi:Fic family protein